MATGRFTIDDAFESDDEDPIRIYGATTESAPLHEKRRPQKKEDPPEEQRETTDSKAGLLSGSRVKNSDPATAESLHSFSTQSDSYSVSTKTFPDTRWWRHPKVRENWKIVIASFTLLGVGIALLITGVAIELSNTTAVQSYVFFIAGTICLIPGAYHVVYIICAVKGKRGFSFYNLPVLR